MATIVLMGRVTGDIELKHSLKGVPYVQFSVAENKGYGEKQTTQYYSLVAYREVAENMERSKVNKGSLITVTGNDVTLDIFQKRDGSTGATIKAKVLSWDYVPSGRATGQERTAGELAQRGEQKTQKETTGKDRQNKEADADIVECDDGIPDFDF